MTRGSCRRRRSRLEQVLDCRFGRRVMNRLVGEGSGLRHSTLRAGSRSRRRSGCSCSRRRSRRWRPRSLGACSQRTCWGISGTSVQVLLQLRELLKALVFFQLPGIDYEFVISYLQSYLQYIFVYKDSLLINLCIHIRSAFQAFLLIFFSELGDRTFFIAVSTYHSLHKKEQFTV